MDRDIMIQCMRDGCTLPQLHEILDYIDDLEKYKSLYENEKDHTDTLLRIMFKMFDLLDSDKQQIVRPLFESYPNKVEPFFKLPYEFTCKGGEEII